MADLRAHRLVLAALNEDDESYEEILAELVCGPEAEGVIAALVDGLRWELDHRHGPEGALREVEKLIAEGLESEQWR